MPTDRLGYQVSVAGLHIALHLIPVHTRLVIIKLLKGIKL